MASEEEASLKTTIVQLTTRLEFIKAEEAAAQTRLNELRSQAPQVNPTAASDDTETEFSINSLLAQANIVSSESSNYFQSQVTRQLKALENLKGLFAQQSGSTAEVRKLVEFISKLDYTNIEERNLTKPYHIELLVALIASLKFPFDTIMKTSRHVSKVRTFLQQMKSIINMVSEPKFKSVFRCAFVNATTNIAEAIYEANLIILQSNAGDAEREAALSIFAKFIELQCQATGVTLILLDKTM